MKLKKYWYWPGHGILIKDKLFVFIMKLRSVTDEIGFEAYTWLEALISNCLDSPGEWFESKEVFKPDYTGIKQLFMY